jgi:hypothetical protein
MHKHLARHNNTNIRKNNLSMPSAWLQPFEFDGAIVKLLRTQTTRCVALLHATVGPPSQSVIQS